MNRTKRRNHMGFLIECIFLYTAVNGIICLKIYFLTQKLR